MKCEQIRSLLSPYVDGMTDNKETQMIEAHIADCAECRRQLKDYLSLGKMMKNMDELQVPDQFAADLQRRLHDEQNKIWGSYPMKTPKKSGWVAAGLAVIALTAGIYSSSFVPLGKYITAWYDKGQTDPKKPVLSIDNIIKRFHAWNQEKDENQKTELAQENENEPAKTRKPAIKSKTPTEQSGNPEEAPVESKAVVATIKVSNMEDALARIINMAESNGVKYTVMATDSVTQSTLPKPNARQVVLSVEQGDAEQVLEELKNLGVLEESEAAGENSDTGVNMQNNSPRLEKKSLPVQKADTEESRTLGEDKDSLPEQKTDSEENPSVEPDVGLVQPEETETPPDSESVQPDVELAPSDNEAAPSDARTPSSDEAKPLLKEDENLEQSQDEEQKQLSEQSHMVTITVNLIEEREDKEE